MQTDLRLREATFRALGSQCRIVSDVESCLLPAVHRLEDLEARWSRFLPSSEVSTLNNADGAWCDVSEVTHELVRRAIEATSRTGGIMNPFMLNQLIELGYDRSHEQLIQPTTDQPFHGDTAAVGAAQPVGHVIDQEGGRIRLAEGVGFDPGGVGKGLAADLVMADLLDAGSTWALVSLGGDLRFGGSELESRGWDTIIEDPQHPGETWGAVNMRRGALATSSTLTRCWRHAGGTNHHLLDPRTGAPAASCRIAATVHASEAWWADVVAKVLVIDPTCGQYELDAWGATALVFEEGRTIDLGLSS